MNRPITYGVGGEGTIAFGSKLGQRARRVVLPTLHIIGIGSVVSQGVLFLKVLHCIDFEKGRLINDISPSRRMMKSPPFVGWQIWKTRIPGTAFVSRIILPFLFSRELLSSFFLEGSIWFIYTTDDFSYVT